MDEEIEAPEIKTKPSHSEKLTRMLTAQRTAAIQAVMLTRPDVALAALVHRHGLAGFRERIFIKPDRAGQHRETQSQAQCGEHRAEPCCHGNRGKARYWQGRIDAAGEGGKSLFGWLLEQDVSDLHDLLAFCTAASINTVSGRENTPSDDVAALMIALNLDMADWWKPTPENYLAHVSKEQILSVVTEAVSAGKADLMRGLKKQELVRKADEELSSLRWLPENFKVSTPQEEQ